MNTQNELENQVLQVPIEDIIPNRFQPRLAFDDDALNDLADSIKQHGIIQPLVLRRKGDKYEIIAGERRYKASKLAGLASVPAVISNLDDNASAEVAIVENVQRKDLTAIEEAKSYQALLDKGYMTQDELAKKMGLSQSAISNKLRLLTLDESVQNAVLQGEISERHARTLLKVPSHEMQKELLSKTINERMTVKQLEDEIKKRVASEVNVASEEIPKVTSTTEVPDPVIPSFPDSTLPEIVMPVEEKVEEEEVEVVPPEPDIPLVNNSLDINKIKSNAVDITPIAKPEELMIEEVKPSENLYDSPEQMTNKFFNYLEDSAANMNLEETPVYEVHEEKQVEELKPTDILNQTDNIEMLDDFIIPVEANDTPVMNNNYLDTVIKTIRGLNLDSDKVVIEEINLPAEYHINIKIKKDKI